jgi:hypothetical protein
MEHYTRKDPQVKQRVVRHAHAPEEVWVETRTNVKKIAERNAKIRNDRLLVQGKASPFADGDELTAAFQFDTVMAYQLAKAKYPDLFAQAEAGGEIGVRAGEQLALLLPEYVTMVKRRV